MQADKSWYEIVDRKDDFQEILQLLVQFDENTGRYRRRDPQNHFLRKACAVAPVECLRIFVQRLDQSVYYLVLRLDSPGGHEVTGYIHEDGIYQERNTAPADHPVHTIPCLTDLFEAAVSIAPESQTECLREFLQFLPARGAK